MTKKVTPALRDFRIVYLSLVTKKSYRPALVRCRDISRRDFMNAPGTESVTHEIIFRRLRNARAPMAGNRCCTAASESST